MLVIFPIKIMGEAMYSVDVKLEEELFIILYIMLVH